jgi:HTH-type transcriptional regulator, cell division transcriptional repressor
MLGDRVRQRRDELELTQEQLAAVTGLKQFHISRIESGDIKDVKGETLRRLARALRVTADFLLEIDETEESERLTAVAP